MHKQISLKIPLSASRGLPLALEAFVLGGGQSRAVKYVDQVLVSFGPLKGPVH